MTKIWVHTLVRNEARWVWYSVMSVINHVDRVLLWDMESTDNTYKICEEIRALYPGKVDLRKVGKGDASGFAKVRQEMLDETKSDWFIVVDGDEVWWEESIAKVVSVIEKKGGEIESILVPFINAVGDVYHYQEKLAGRYSIAGHTGHLSIRAINRKIPGLSSSLPHGKWGWTDGKGRMVQDRDERKIFFVDATYIHATHLPRAFTREFDNEVVKRSKKLKHEIGKAFPRDFYYPEVFFQPRPEVVPSVWEPMSKSFYFRSTIETLPRKIKRRVWKGKSGY